MENVKVDLTKEEIDVLIEALSKIGIDWESLYHFKLVEKLATAQAYCEDNHEE